MENPRQGSEPSAREDMSAGGKLTTGYPSIKDIGRDSRFQDDEPPIGQQEIYNLSHWGCIGYLILLVIVTGATIFQAIRIWLDPGKTSPSPVTWIVAIFLLIVLIAALGWAPISIIARSRRKKIRTLDDDLPATEHQQ